MAKRKRRSIRSYLKRRRNGTRDRRIPLIKTAVAIAPTALAIKEAYDQNGGNIGQMLTTAMNGDGLIEDLVYQNTGIRYVGGFSMDTNILMRNIGMWAGGYLASAVVNRLGVNKTMKRIPFIGRVIKL